MTRPAHRPSYRGLALLVLAAAPSAQGREAARAVPVPGTPTVPVPARTISLERPMLRGDTPATGAGWRARPLVTIGETLHGYQPVGVPDGVGAFQALDGSVEILVNHELAPRIGYAYALGNGTLLTGARISRFEVVRTLENGRALADVRAAGLAYHTIMDRAGQVVTAAVQVNETGSGIDGIARLCSGMAVAAGTHGFVDDVFLAGEESGKPGHPHGGSEWALDVERRTLWAVPAFGRGAWENVTPIATGDPGTVALLGGDDTPGAPLYLYVGEKDALGDGSFLDRNGLAVGRLHAWRADAGDLDPQTFNGQDAARAGTFVEVTVRDPAQAGMPGYDAAGYADIDTLQAEADALGCFSFSRPEDVDTNPLDGTQAVVASTGRGQLYPADTWGTLYVADVDVGSLTALLVIVHDADGLPVPDTGIRSPDNLDWAGDGKIYVQEDRSTSPSSLFGSVTGVEASVWQLDPITHGFLRIAEMDRSAVAPAGSTDGAATVFAAWESSGVLDVTALFPTLPDERLLIATVQAHGIQDGPIGGSALLSQGGQLLFLSKLGN